MQAKVGQWKADDDAMESERTVDAREALYSAKSISYLDISTFYCAVVMSENSHATFKMSLS